MELNDAQTIVDPASDLRGLRVRCELGYGCHTTSSRRVHFLAEECVAELFEQFVCFHGLSWFVGLSSQIELPPAQFPKPLHKFSGIGPRQLFCLIG